MFSYRHAFHAGNHGDVLKHLALVATLRHLITKDAPLAAFDTHAGAGLYRLDGDYAHKSGEAAEGLLQLSRWLAGAGQITLPPALHDYLELVAGFNAAGSQRVYPGSPFIVQRLLRPQDRLKLFELHPTDGKTLAANIAQLDAGRQVAVLREDGFAALPRLLPPPQRRALVLIDPSYEIKADYGRVAAVVGEALQRFATGVYLVWYPIIPRPEAHELPRRLRTLATRARRSWLHATLTTKGGRAAPAPDSGERRPGMPGSGVFVINPPHTLRDALKEALPVLVEALRQDRHARYSVDAST